MEFCLSLRRVESGLERKALTTKDTKVHEEEERERQGCVTTGMDLV